MKKRILKKSLSLVLALLILFASAPLNKQVASSLNLKLPKLSGVWSALSGALGSFITESNAANQNETTWSYNEKSETLTIGGSGDMEEYDRDKAPWAKYNSRCKAIVIEDQVTSISSGAFFIFRQVKSVVLGKSLQRIDQLAFSNCSALMSVTFGDAVTSIEWYAFDDCVSLEQIHFGKGLTVIGTGAFDNCTGLTNLRLPSGLQTIGEGAFSGCAGLKNAELPLSLTSIGAGAFENCRALASITLPFTGNGPKYSGKNNSRLFGVIFGTTHYCGTVAVTQKVPLYSNSPTFTYYIPASLSEVTMLSAKQAYGFYGCNAVKHLIVKTADTVSGNFASGWTGLETVAFTGGKTVVNSKAFQNCSSLKSVDFGDQTAKICKDAFLDCPVFEEVRFGSAVTVDELAFEKCTALKKVSFAAVRVNLGDRAFEGTPWFDSLTETYCTVADHVLIKYNGAASIVTIPSGVKYVAATFSGDSTLKKVIFPSTVEAIGTDAFKNCTALTDITFGGGLDEIGDYAFEGCTGLQKLAVPDTVQHIGLGAFYACSSLTELNLPFIGESKNAVSHNNVFSYIFSSSDTKKAGHCSYTSCTVGEKNVVVPLYQMPAALQKVTVKSGDAAGGAFYQAKIGSLTLGENFGKVSFGAFCNSKVLSVVMNGGTIEDYGFYHSAVQSITLPGTLKRIGANAFQKAASLCTIQLPESLEEIGDFAFNQCSSLQFADLVLPQSVRKIGAKAFANIGKIASVTLGKNVSSLDATVFMGNNDFVSAAVDAENPYYSSADGVVYSASGELVLYPCAKKDALTIPKNLTGFSSETLDQITAFADEAENPLYTVRDGVLYNHDLTEIIRCSKAKTGDYVAPQSVVNVPYHAFYQCTSLNSVTILNPDAVFEKGSFSDAVCTSFTVPAFQTTLEFVDLFGNDTYMKVKNITLTHQNEALSAYCFMNCGASVIQIDGSLQSLSEGAFMSCSNLTVLKLPDSIETIGIYACENCNSLLDVTLPKALIDIGGDAFVGCTRLKTLVLPATLENIGAGAFLCDRQFSVDLPKNLARIGPGAFSYTKMTSVVIPASIKKIGENAFSNCDVTEIRYEKQDPSLQYMDQGVFSGCQSLAKLYLPAGCTNIPDRMFENCVNLSAAELPNTVQTIGAKAFKNTGVKTVVIPSSIKMIGNEAFSQSGVTEIRYESADPSLQYMGKRMFSGCKSLTKLFLPKGCTNIPISMFEDCTGITEAAWPEGVLTVGADAFKGCVNLTDAELPNTVQIIGDEAFKGAGAQTVVIPASIEKIGEGAFSQSGVTEIRYESKDLTLQYMDEGVFKDCKSLKKLFLPTGCTNIPAHMFQGCENLCDAELPNTVQTIGDEAFMGAGIQTVVIPASIEKIGEGAFSQSGVTEIRYESKDPTLQYMGKYVFIGCKSLTELFLPAGCTNIPEGMFMYCSGLTTLNIPNTVQTIGVEAFYADDKVSELTLPDSVTDIGFSAFFNCISLVKATLPQKLEKMAKQMFFGDNKLTVVVINPAATMLESEALASCPALSVVVVPDSVTSIANDAFKASPNVTIYCNKNSYAESYAKANTIKYTTLTLSAIEDQTYTGKAIEPSVTATTSGRVLQRDTEYKVTYRNNIRVGSASIFAKGLGDFVSLTATGQFLIMPKSVSDVKCEITPEVAFVPEKDAKPTVTVTDNNKVLTENVDYELICADGASFRKTGTVGVTVAGIGNYNGVQNLTFLIAPKALTNVNAAYTDGVRLTDGNYVLVENVDYTVKITNDEKGNGHAAVRGIGNYVGEVTLDVPEKKPPTEQQLLEKVLNLLIRFFGLLQKLPN